MSGRIWNRKRCTQHAIQVENDIIRAQTYLHTTFIHVRVLATETSHFKFADNKQPATYLVNKWLVKTAIYLMNKNVMLGESIGELMQAKFRCRRRRGFVFRPMFRPLNKGHGEHFLSMMFELKFSILIPTNIDLLIKKQIILNFYRFKDLTVRS